MIQGSDGLFYRTTKYEETTPLHVFVDAAKYPLGEFKRLRQIFKAETSKAQKGLAGSNIIRMMQRLLTPNIV